MVEELNNEKDKEKTKISVDEIVNQKDIILIRSIECPIDNMVPLENYAEICKKCQTVYCMDCIQVWKKTSNICPMRCSPMQLIKVQDTIVAQQLAAIKIKCKYEFFGCDEKILLKEYRKHEIECPYRQETCQACNYPKCHFLMIHHLLKECENLKLQCFICSNKYHFGDIQEHISKCLEVNIYCDICNGYHNKSLSNCNSKGGGNEYKCRLSIETCKKCGLPELNYLIGTPEHICLNSKNQSNQLCLNNYLLQLSVRVHVSMEKSLKDREKNNQLFISDFHDKLKFIQRVYFNKIYSLYSKKKKISEDYKRRIQNKNNSLKEDISKIEENIQSLQLKRDSK